MLIFLIIRPFIAESKTTWVRTSAKALSSEFRRAECATRDWIQRERPTFGVVERSHANWFETITETAIHGTTGAAAVHEDSFATAGYTHPGGSHNKTRATRSTAESPRDISWSPRRGPFYRLEFR